MVEGAAGTAGAPGMDGDPAGPGGPGGPGENVSAVADVAGESNTATATGGEGGAGGPGGDADDPGLPGGAGGVGGGGGDAQAQATTQGATAAVATATGGNAGLTGLDGAGEDPDVLPRRGEAGGSATASATLENDGADAAQVIAEAFGGDGGAISVPDEEDLPSGGGDATASASGSVEEGALSVRAMAEAGRVLGGPSGLAAATAFGENTGTGAVDVRAHAQAGLGVASQAPALVEASAEGHSVDGDVTVTAIQEVGPVIDGGVFSEMHDAVSGSTAGKLTLRQELESAAGDTSTSLRATNPGGGDLSVRVDVGILQAGPRPDVFLTAGETANVYVGDVTGTSTTGANVDVLVSAKAGVTRSGSAGSSVFQQNLGPGGASTPSVIRGDSNGGAVRVGAFFDGGAVPDAGPTPSAVPGGAIDLVNAVRGDTSGDLTLVQFGRAGTGQSGFSSFYQVPFRGGDGGAAFSELVHEGSSTSMQMIGVVSGGEAGESGEGFEFADAGTARSVVDGVNRGGSIEVLAAATGGSDGWGGAADVDVSARTTENGDDVRITVDRTLNPFFQRAPGVPSGPGPFRFSGGAIGGGGQQIRVSPFLPPPEEGGDLPDGGDANSHSIGIAEGDSRVEVQDLAQGGRGGRLGPVPPATPVSGTAGDGGDAFSTAVAQGGGSSLVMASATADGGSGGVGVLRGGSAGDATADASATGLGPVEAVANASAGDVGSAFGAAGTGLATASASGASGFAMAAATSGNLRASLGATASADVASGVDVRSQAAFGTSLPGVFRALDRQADALMTGDPLADDVAAAIRDNAALADLLDTTQSEVVALGAFETIAGEAAALSTRSIALDITLSERDADNRLRLAAFDIAAIGDGFEQLSFRLERGGDAFGDTEVFDDFAAAVAFFENGLFDVGPGSDGALSAIFDVTLGEGDGFGMRLAFVVPEPSTGLLLGLALVALSLRGRGRVH